jgi:hypothetical protein
VAKSRALFQPKATLQGVQSPICGAFQVWEDTTLAQLHRMLQIVMSWEDDHLHEFRIGRRLYGRCARPGRPYV